MKIALFGKDGQVGWELQRSLSIVGEVLATEQDELDFERPDSLREWIRRHRPDAIVNAAAYTAVDQAESEPEKAERINAEAVGIMAEEARRLNAWLIHYSTDYVFDGTKATPYEEEDKANPLSVYGRTKWEGEEAIRSCHDRHIIFRTSWVFASRGKNFIKTILRLAKEKESLRIIADQWGAPTSAELLADVTALALHRVLGGESESHLSGTYHLVAAGETTWHEYARYVLALAQACGATLKIGPEAVTPIPTEAYPLPAKRPKNSRLSTAKVAQAFGVCVPDWQYHVRRSVDELIAQGAA
ncbi:MAG: dTDP-4-dehydrorhamnose reductase [Nitrospira sp.]|nr:dTDP-4-dehydrorhamnose reductase [Nitrospira sp.]